MRNQASAGRWWNPSPRPSSCWLEVSQAVGRAGGWRRRGLRRLWVWPHVPFCFYAAAPRLSVFPGPILHCSSNNCCGTLNICKPPLLRGRLCFLCSECDFAARPVRRCAARFDAGHSWYQLRAAASVFAQLAFCVGDFFCAARLWEQMN